MVSPSLESFLECSADYDRYPIKDEFLFDTETPISLSERFFDSDHLILFESAEKDERWARFSYVANNPRKVVTVRGYEVNITEGAGKSAFQTKDPVSFINRLLSEVRYPRDKAVPGFCTGYAGYFAYDAVRYTEKLPELTTDDMGFPDICLMEFNELYVIDHFRHTLTIIVNAFYDVPDRETEYLRAAARIRELKDNLVKTRIDHDMKMTGRIPEFAENISRKKYMEMVDRARGYIRAGDIFQVVLSRRIRHRLNAEPLDIYRMLRLTNPSPYMFYIKLNDSYLIGSSPEMMLKTEAGVVETCPIAGTRKRGRNTEEDIRLEKELMTDGKEVSEHMMLVDLGRNDIGRVSEIGSVTVEDLMHVEKYSRVMHLVTTVKGRLKKGMTALDALMALMPAGTLSGAPKIRSMEIIEELEKERRGPYGGAAGFISFSGDADFCIIIRTIMIKDKMLYIQSGAGIVAESDPEREYDETSSKASAMLNAVLKAGGWE